MWLSTNNNGNNYFVFLKSGMEEMLNDSVWGLQLNSLSELFSQSYQSNFVLRPNYRYLQDAISYKRAILYNKYGLN